ncbi:hypothetical protein CLU81_2999 [Flavobacterium sp. 9]|uniref:hypothetical protein n=1 Tax=Flavobacterium sp. 9 TaxID=2035198 RepID=UPI000C177F69|nr:hypothetical protein [Flavobacterium sp. 9]PIF32459.1 hypothetical protein CLU81_2999 [Flavobacterium sp. 9]
MDYLNSFFQNIKDKLSNPFFGTLILILIINHWELWYSLFNFDNNYSRNAKVSLIRNLVDYELTHYNIFIDITNAVIITIVGYIIIVGTRTLSMLIEFKIMPYITGKVINKNVVLKSTHDETVTERDEYSEKYEEQRKNVRLLSKNYDEQIEQIKNKDFELAKAMESVSQITKDLNSSQQKSLNIEHELQKSLSQIKILESETREQRDNLAIMLNNLNEFRSLFFNEENKSFWDSPHKFPTIIIDKVREIKEANKWEQFLDVANHLEVGGTMASNRIIEIKEFGVINQEEGRNFKQLSPIGEIIFKYRSILENIEIDYDTF